MIAGICNKCGLLFHRDKHIEAGLELKASMQCIPIECVWHKTEHERLTGHEVSLKEMTNQDLTNGT